MKDYLQFHRLYTINAVLVAQARELDTEVAELTVKVRRLEKKN